MKLSKKVIALIAMLLVLAIVLTTCHYSCGTDDVSGSASGSVASEDMSVSDSSEAVDDESSQAEESSEVSTEDASDEYASGDETPWEEPISDPDTVLVPKEEADADQEVVYSEVKLPSGRDWVKYVLDVEVYRNSHKDLQEAFGDNWDAYVDHWLNTGVHEGRTKGVLFDPFAYADAYPDVKEECGNDVMKIIEHYITHGINENRPLGTTQGYEDMADKISREEMVGGDIDRTPSSRLEALVAHAENAFIYGKNIEGSLFPQLFVDGIDRVTKEPVIWSKGSSNEFYVSNLYGQSNFLKMLYDLSEFTGDAKYKEAALAQIKIRYDNPDSSAAVNDGWVDTNGLFYAGGHSVSDVKTGKQGFLYHETKDYQLPVELYYEADPVGFERYVTAFWNAHTLDPSQLNTNRHGDFNKPLANGDFWSSEYTNPSPWIKSDTAPFIVTANDMIDLAYYQYIQSRDDKYKIWADRLLAKYIAITDVNTGLTGPVYGIMHDDDGEYGDRWLDNFIGADFVDDLGHDYKTLTQDDSQIVGETQRLNRDTTKGIQGYGPQIYIELYEKTDNEVFYNFVKNNMLGFVRYIYDPIRHVFLTPISTNGTDFNKGDGYPKLVAPRGGYYLNEGKSFAESESVHQLVLASLIDTVNMLNPEDAAEAEELWATVRTWAGAEDLGDVGTAMGENVNVNLNTRNNNPMNTIAVLKLYKYTKNEQYYNLAIKMADNILRSYFDEESGLFMQSVNAPFVKFDSEPMYAVFCVEAMVQGKIDTVNMQLSHNGLDYLWEGQGQNSDNAMFYTRSKVKAGRIDLGGETYSLVLAQEPNIEINDIASHEDEKAIRQMVAMGAMDIDSEGNFAPDSEVTRGQLVEMVVDLFGFTDTTVPGGFRFTDVADKSYYEAVVAAENAGILDENLGATSFNGDAVVTKEEMASIIVKSLQAKNPDETYYVADALYRIKDTDVISPWAVDYVDIATNYRLMIEITEDSFGPKDNVTKAFVATTFQNLGRYIPFDVQKLTATVSPYNADSATITWLTSDPSILEIDEQGRLYPLKSGAVIVTAIADEVQEEIEVIVSATEEWMIKEITIDGEVIDGFNASTTEYDVNLNMGTTTVPVVAAESFSGAPVEIKLPEALPGRVELNVQGSNVKYIVDLDNTFIKYAVNENFNHRIGTLIKKMTADTYGWYTESNDYYDPYWKVVPRNWVNTSEEGYGCFSFPYRHDLDMHNVIRLSIHSDYDYHIGPEQDDMLVVVEMELAVRNLADKGDGFSIYFSEAYPTVGTKSIARFNINNQGEFKRLIDGSTFNEGTAMSLEDDKFYTLKLVIDKKTGTFSYYLDDVLLEKGVKPYHSSVTGLGCIMFQTRKQDEYSNAEMWFDNIKIYELTKEYVEATMSQNPIPTFTPKPTAAPKPEWVEFPVNETYDDYAVDTLATATAEGKGYVWQINGQVYPTLVKVVSKSAVDANAAATDNCLEIPYDHATGAGTYRLNLDENLVYKLGAEASDNKSIVLEMDLAVKSTVGQKLNSFRVYLSQRAGGGGYSSTSRFVVNEDRLGRMVDSSTLKDDKIYPMNNGEFVHLKVVVNKQTKKFTYYVNEMPIEVGVSAIHSAVPNIGTIYIDSPVEMTTVESKLYIDNLKLYVEETKPDPTEAPAPTPKPTATPKPYPVYETYDSYPETTMLKDTATQDYAWAMTSGFDTAGAVVPKSAVFAGADATDMCVKLPYSTARDVSYLLNLTRENAFPLGDQAINDKKLVVELDVAIAGTGTKANGYRLFFSRANEGGSHSVGRFIVGETDLARYLDSSTLNDAGDRPALTKGQFTTIKLVIDQTTKKFDYYVDGQPVETGVSPVHSSVPDLGTIQIQALKETAETDVALYIDNLKVYLAEEGGEGPAAPTPRPTEGPGALDENWDAYTVGTTFTEGTKGNGYSWVMSERYRVNGVVIAPKTEVVPTADASDKVAKIEYHHDYNQNGWLYMDLNDGKAISIGDGGGYAVFETDIAITGADYKTFWLCPMTRYNTSPGGWTNYFMIEDGKLFDRHYADTTTDMGKNEFHKLQLVVDRTARTYSYSVDGVVKLSNVPMTEDLCTEMGSLEIRVYKESVDLDATMYLDNVKMYSTMTNPLLNVPVATPVPTATPAPTIDPAATPTPAPTVAPTDEPAVLDENWDDVAEGDIVSGTTGTNYSWLLGGAVKEVDALNVVPKSTVVSTASATDKCVEITYRHAATGEGKFWIELEEAKQIAVGTGTSGYAVMELDVALGGEGSKTRWQLYPNIRQEVGTSSVARFYIDNGVLYDKEVEAKQNDLGKNTFHNIKVVIDRANRTYTYLFDDVVQFEGQGALHGGFDALGSIYVGVPKESADVDAKLYLDNAKIYVTYTNPVAPVATPEPTEAPAVPTEAPTEAPAVPTATVAPAVPTATVAPTAPTETPVIVVEETWDGKAAAVIENGATGTNYSVLINSAYKTLEAAKIVPKSNVVSTADATDMCAEFTYKHDVGNGGFYLTLDEGKAIAVGAGNEGYAVLEYDVAFGGADTKTQAKLHANVRQENGTSSAVRLWTNAGSIYDYAVGDTNAVDLGKNTFHNVKIVIDRANRTYEYLLDGEVEVTGRTVLHTGFSELGCLYIELPAESADMDAKVYIDNMKFYTTEQNPVAPAATPAPTEAPAIPTEAPTAAPTTAPTEAPTAAPTVAPVVIVDENWNAATAGVIANRTAGTNYSWLLGGAIKELGTIQVVPKSNVVSTAAADDKCVEIAYNHNASGLGKYYLTLDAGKAVTVGTGTTGYAVLEYEVALGGEGTLERWQVYPNVRQDSGDYSVGRMYIDGTTAYDKDVENKTTDLGKKTFHTVKYVIDRANRTYTFILDGTTQFENRAALHTNFTELGAIFVGVPKQSADVDAKIYLDNVKFYTTETNPVAATN